MAGSAALSVAFLNHPGKEGTLAGSVESPGDATPVSGCANTACNDACWEDGTHSNPGTFAKQTLITPSGCEGVGGCVTSSCF
jgi:hypothetical protein